jgi:hypothetical protein
MLSNERHEPNVRRHRRSVVAAVLAVALIGTGLIAASAEAAKSGFPMSYDPETAAGYTNTFTSKSQLNPACPQAIAGTPGSDPASKVLNAALNTPASFQAGGTVHFTYRDNPHTNGGKQNFTIQDCVVTYPAGTFSPSDFDPVTGVLLNASKSALNGGTQIDGASLTGISSSVGNIYFSWTAPADLAVDTWVCFFARDVQNNHGGGGNRKVPPTCYLSTSPDPDPDPDPDLAPSIYLAYVDNYHDAAGTTIPWAPTPWAGDPSVVFVGCTTAADCGKYDGGAIRIDNAATNTGTLTLDSASVAIGACTFNPWTALLPQAAAPGESLVLTQTGLLGPPMPAPCREAIDPMVWDYTNFDTSERPGDNRGFPTFADRKFDCNTTTGATPVITLNFAGGITLTVNDTGKVLNTGGIDSQACFGINEATPWTGPIPY